MTAPMTFTPRVLGDVDAKLVAGSDQDIENVRIWVRSLLGEDSVAPVTYMNRGTVRIETENFSLYVYGGQYIVWDGLTLRAVEKLPFELIYTPSS